MGKDPHWDDQEQKYYIDIYLFHIHKASPIVVFSNGTILAVVIRDSGVIKDLFC